ncbi:hypothetical protein BST95_05555 [Halioglobus japonicus]|uniref:Glycoside hydrolase family 3 protein n=1 Tax=Halioglobus japonicus TaxID=930805 RepID=A0AAP8MDE8_9GAMM|nr:glycoside hydrolase family 3 protein [Halioglobus japonicus]AQA17777.1 hypothetical protein BST95_05555 [Halioglobus japonicus]PLW85731.1 glycoside hydrolase family 3 protein [Halioglobus japonicus]GHD17211.1 beta-N-acetylhexosaminidase [Halioglobus japonicus]
MTATANISIEQCVALKLMVDIRLYDSGDGAQPVLNLPAALADGLARLQPGGVIVFRENLASTSQVRELTDELRACISPELLIGIDQEGGRVTRLPRGQCTSFSGNMALAACPEGDRISLARDMAVAQGEELRALGINCNFVPSLDVNSNPANPVIHVRAFSDDPALVAELGAAVTAGIQSVGVAASLKHFPGHGDTSQDSHTGLPRVDRTCAQAQAMDLAPFASVIDTTTPAMVMTAHIQYPALDNSVLLGTDIVRPATLSRTILTDVLRYKLGFAGVVITDAMDMRAISAILTPQAAVLEAFRAGVDIALMPMLLRDAQSLAAMFTLVDDIAAAVRSGELDERELRESAERVLALRHAYPIAPHSAEPAVIGSASHRKLEQRIAASSITLLQGDGVLGPEVGAVHLLLPGDSTARALAAALQAANPDLAISWQSLENFDLDAERRQLAACDAYVVGVSEPAISAVVAGGAEDLPNLPDLQSATVVKALLAGAQDKQRIVAMLYSPYRAAEFFGCADSILATYGGAAEGFGGAPGPAYVALAKVLAGEAVAPGTLPVTL